METEIFTKMDDNYIVNSIRGITKDGSNLKNAIFKANILKADVDEKAYKVYLNAVNNFLRFWDEHARELGNRISSAKGASGIVSTSYERIKDFLHVSYDYASVLPFTDGVIQGVRDGKFTTSDDIDYFRDHTLSKAFKGCPNTSASLLDSVLSSSGSIGSYDKPTAATAFDAKMFDSVTNMDLFDQRDRPELYNAIYRVVDFMSKDIDTGKYLSTKDMRLFVSMINNVVDYMTYSLTAYACRIYIIESYAYPFIAGSSSVEESVLTEDAEHDNSPEIDIFRTVDDTICRDPAKTREFINTFEEFLTAIGADYLFTSKKPSYDTTSIDDPALENNAFCSKLMINPLHEFITKRRHSYMYHDDLYNSMADLRVVLHELIYNSSHGIQGETSPKQELLHVIRGTTCDDTLKGYQELSKDLYLCAFQLCGHLDSFITKIIQWRKMEVEDPSHNTAALNNAVECLKIASEFYRDLSTAILVKARDIEMHINNIRSKDVNKIIAGLSIKIPNEKSDIDSNENMMTAVPDTTRIPDGLLDLYDVPTFEALMLYDEYVKNLPFMEGDLYYSEAFNISTIIDKIIAAIRAAWKRFEQFWNDKSVQISIKWITDHEQELMSMDFSNLSMRALKHKVNIGFPAGFDNLHKGLSGFSPKNFESKESIDKFIKGLYPDGVYDWFADPSNKDGKEAAAKYRNYILFYDINEVKAEQPPLAPFNGHQIQRAVPEWIKTIKTVKEALDGYTAKGKELEADVTKIRNQVANMTDTTGSTSTNTTGTSNNGNDAKGTPGMTTPPAEGENGKKPAAKVEVQVKNNSTPAGTTSTGDDKAKQANEAANSSSAAILEIQAVIDRIYRSLANIFIEYIQTMYDYLKKVYTAAKGSK